MHVALRRRCIHHRAHRPSTLFAGSRTRGLSFGGRECHRLSRPYYYRILKRRSQRNVDGAPLAERLELNPALARAAQNKKSSNCNMLSPSAEGKSRQTTKWGLTADGSQFTKEAKHGFDGRSRFDDGCRRGRRDPSAQPHSAFDRTRTSFGCDGRLSL